MATIERLAATDLRAGVRAYRDALRQHQAALNRLNVYPVPDGDTGTNMALTLESVVAEIDGAAGAEPAAMAEVCRAIAHGSLMGARGNSGVILSQILRGVADQCKDAAAVDGATMAAALKAAAEAAYQAVMRPVEGTILTVARAAAEAVGGDDPSLVAVLDAARTAAADALARTPELLPVLKQAGVVDAGGAGFVLFLDALLLVVDGRPVPAPADLEGDEGPVAEVAARPSEGHEVGDLRYEVMFFLEADDATIPRFKDVWAGVGDSIVVVGGDGLWNCHIHTDDIGAAIEAAIDCGRPKKIRVTDLMEQVEEERWVREAAAGAEAGDDMEAESEPVRCAVVAVATGDGIQRIFRSLGVQRMVAGGQSMNPSTAQILDAVEGVAADEIVVLPNNKNIIPVAEQVMGLSGRTVRVLPTRSVAEGFAALMEYDPQCTAEENQQAMAEATRRIVSGEVTRAVRASACDLGPIGEGDYLGIGPGGIQAIEGDLVAATTALLDVLVGDDHEVVTLIEGEGAAAATTREVTEWLAEHRPAVEVEVHHGGQPLYPYLLSIE